MNPQIKLNTQPQELPVCSIQASLSVVPQESSPVFSVYQPAQANQQNIVVTPAIETPQIEQIDRLAQGIVMPPRIEIDPGVLKALDFVRQGLDTIEDEYSLNLKKIIFDLGENESISFLNSLSERDLISILTEDVTIAPASERGLSCDSLALAVLSGRFSLLRSLLAKMEDLNLTYQPDSRFGWNIGHFAALHSERNTLFEIPQIHAVLDQINNTGATPRDFAFWLSDPSPEPIAAHGNEHPPLSHDEFRLLTQCNYWSRPKFTPGAILRLAFEAPQFNSAPRYLSFLLKPIIDNYIDTIHRQPCHGQPCKIKIRKMNSKDTPAQLKGQWECALSQDVEKGEIIDIYSGTVFQSRWSATVSEVGLKRLSVCNDMIVDAELGGGNLAQFINHGFPNCAFFYHIYRGIPVIIIIALEKMDKNSTLFLSYGPNYFNNFSGDVFSLNQSGISKYLKETNNLRKIHFLEFKEDGNQYYYVDRGEIKTKNSNAPAPLCNAIDAFSHKVRLSYLTAYEKDKVEQMLEKDRKTKKWFASGDF